ncbi:hypothetical protein Salat_0478600 [Sesamum alatum]|uniref:Uncharacterized protein n=1 Tax=Sesamum alatum TaxID=300844 RepID=A0AAE2D0G4_9LAMI|nr:hypothetical protein Salat_0478600 [Sesamum alatum]
MACFISAGGGGGGGGGGGIQRAKTNLPFGRGCSLGRVKALSLSLSLPTVCGGVVCIQLEKRPLKKDAAFTSLKPLVNLISVHFFLRMTPATSTATPSGRRI